MKNAKKIGIAIVQVVIAGILVFIAIKICNDNKHEDVDVGQVAVEEVEETPESSETDESLTDSTIKSELENNDLHANAGGSGEISLEETEDGSFKDPAIDHQDENNTSENNITSEHVINGHGTETTENLPKTSVNFGDEDDYWTPDTIPEDATKADLPTEEQSAEAWGYVAENGAVLH